MAVLGTIGLSLLALSLLGALVRILRGPTARDRLLGITLASTTGVGFLVLSSVVLDMPALRDAALAFVALAVVAMAVRLRAEKAAGEVGG